MGVTKQDVGKPGGTPVPGQWIYCYETLQDYYDLDKEYMNAIMEVNNKIVT